MRESLKRHGRLPLEEDDIAQAFGASNEELETDEAETDATGFSYQKLILAIVFSAPVATFLSLVVIDMYEPFAQSVGLREVPVVAAIPATSVENKKDDGAKFEKFLGSIDKSNKQIASAIKTQTTAITKQTTAITKLASKKPTIIKVAPAKAAKQAAPNVVVVRVPTRDKFDLAYEKQKVLELSSLDLDDPVGKSNPFTSVKSRDVLKETIRSLDTIIAAAKGHAEVGDFLKTNALKAKKHATKRLSKLK